MLVDRFNFDLPDSLIAKEPANPRDSAHLLNISSDMFCDTTISSLPSFLKEGDVMVFNNTRVIPARLKGKRRNRSIEATLHKHLFGSTWKAFAKPSKKLGIGDVFQIADDFYADIMDKGEAGEVTLKFNVDENLHGMLEKYGLPPLPPYITKKREAAKDDITNYQTIYAEINGAVAAPTAGLHFTDELLKEINKIGVRSAFITLHVGAGTFLPVKTKDTEDHRMHSEFCTITKENADIINNAKRVVSVGTTSLRTLESAADDRGIIHPISCETDIFITPGYKFKTTDLLLTNFHLPRSTLFMLVCAFAGEDKMKEAYEHAIKNKYRFYSYGDACLLEKNSLSYRNFSK